MYTLTLRKDTLYDLIARNMLDQIFIDLITEISGYLERDGPSSFLLMPDKARFQYDGNQIWAIMKKKLFCLLFHDDILL